jgi:hypothetical protein
MSPSDVLTDLFGSDAGDLFGAVIANPEGMADLVIRTLAGAGYQIVPADH